MKIETYKYPKSSFLSVDKDMQILIDRMLKDDRLLKLLKYGSPDALSRPKLTEEEKVLTLRLHDETFETVDEQGRKKSVTYKIPPLIRRTPKIFVDATEETYIIIAFDDFTPNANNPQFRDNIIRFDIVCHFEQWELDDMQLRPYKIAAEIDTLFDNQKITGIGELHFFSGQEITMGGKEFAGLRLQYYAIHGGEDKVNSPAPPDRDLEENFDKIFNNR